MALGLAWLCSSLGIGLLGWSVNRLPGQLLLGVAAHGLVATGAVTSNRRRRLTLAFSALASVVVIAVACSRLCSPRQPARSLWLRPW